MRNVPAYQPRRRADQEILVSHALSEISGVAALLDLTPQQLITMFDAGMRATDLAQAVAVKLGAAVAPERD